MKTLYIILAPSRSGKDSLAQALWALRPLGTIRTLKWADHIKRFVETTYRLPPYSLEQDEYRNSFIPGTAKTYLDLLVSLYHGQNNLSDRLMWKRQAMRDFDELMSAGDDVISTDTRDTQEADYLVELAKKYDYQLVLVRLYREGNDGLTSDLLLDRNFRVLSNNTDKVYSYHIPSQDNYQALLVPIARSLSELATKELTTT